MHNIYTVYNSIDASDVARSLDITLIGNNAKNYVLDDATIKYIIDQRPVYVKWIKTAFDYDGNEKSPLYEIVNIVKSDRRNTSVELSYSNYGNFDKYEEAPSNIGTYVAYVTGINNSNYKLINPFAYDSRTIFNICYTDTVYGDRISIGSVTSTQLQEKGVTAVLNNIPEKSQAIELLKNLRDKRLLTNFINLRMDRLLHLNLESDYADIYSEGYESKLKLAEKKLGKSTVKKAFFFDLDMYAVVTGVIDKEEVHNTEFDAEITLTFAKDSNVTRKIMGSRKDYHLIRIHKDGKDEDYKLEFVKVKVTSDKDNYYLTFKSDKFSTYGIY